jgi:uncharacterized protein
MSRPVCCRRVTGEPPSTFFKPRGMRLAALEVVTMTVDEYEAVRLADLEGLYQEDAARRMEVSRQTFGRIIESAHHKIAQALVNGQALEIKGGEIAIAGQRQFQCADCRHGWQIPYRTGRPAKCPKCQSRKIQRAPDERNLGRQGMGAPGAEHAGPMGGGGCR